MKEEFETIEELQAFLTQQTALQNATPRIETDNLSPNDMYIILYQTLEKDSPLSFREDIRLQKYFKKPLKLIPIIIDSLKQTGHNKGYDSYSYFIYEYV